MNRNMLRTTSIGCVLLGLCAAASAAPPAQRTTLSGLVGASDLVFEGQVNRIEYALSDPSGAEKTRTPYTFVTYRVDRVFFGSLDTQEITLRFIGGLDPQSMRYMSSSITPQFDLGDQDILFVQGNTQNLCPLAGNVDGRYRVIGGQVYTETGRAITLGEDGQVRIGARYALDEWQTTNVEGRIFTATADDSTKPLPSTAASADALRFMLTAESNGKRPVNAFVNAFADMPFPGPDMTPAAPPVAKPGEQGPAPADIDPTNPENKG